MNFFFFPTMALNNKVRSYTFATKFTINPLFLQTSRITGAEYIQKTVNLICCVDISNAYFPCDSTFKNNFQTNLN